MKQLKVFTFVCSCNGHFKVVHYSQEEAQKEAPRCRCCGRRPGKLVKVERSL